MKHVGLVYLTLGILLASTPAAAQEGGTDPLAELRQCSGIEENDARLVCYDEQAGALLMAEESGEFRVVDREKAEETRKGLFGFSGIKLPFFDDGEDIDEIASTVTRVRSYGRDGWLLTIEDGAAVWRISNAPMRFQKPEPGDEIVIRRGALGSYFLRVDGQLGVKGRRVE